VLSLRPIKGETPIDLSHLVKSIRKTVTTRGALAVVEAENIRKVTLKYLAKKPTKRQAPFDYSWALLLHRQMFCNVWEWAGKLRNYNTSIGLPWEQVETSLYNLMNGLFLWRESEMPLIEQAATLHYRAVQIHPFPNGNGRWSRLMANIWLKFNDHSIIDWPEAHISGESVIRAEYLDAIKAADKGDLDLLLRLHVRFSPTPTAVLSKRRRRGPLPPPPLLGAPPQRKRSVPPG
jgi:Fic-DOC domain mobile mystery protein B